MSKTYRTTLIFNPNRPDKAAALDWLNHLQKVYPEKSISDIVADLLNEGRSRAQGETDLGSTVSGLTSAVKELTDVIRQMTVQGIPQPLLPKPVKSEKPDMEEVNKMVDLFGY